MLINQAEQPEHPQRPRGRVRVLENDKQIEIGVIKKYKRRHRRKKVDD